MWRIKIKIQRYKICYLKKSILLFFRKAFYFWNLFFLLGLRNIGFWDTSI
jgi:hypothetical protein